MNFDLSAKKKKKKKKTPFDLDAALDGGQENEEKVNTKFYFRKIHPREYLTSLHVLVTLFLYIIQYF